MTKTGLPGETIDLLQGTELFVYGTCSSQNTSSSISCDNDIHINVSYRHIIIFFKQFNLIGCNIDTMYQEVCNICLSTIVPVSSDH